MPKDDSKINIKCSFCGKSQDLVRRIVAGPGVFICDECELCQEIIDESAREPARIRRFEVMELHYTRVDQILSVRIRQAHPFGCGL